MELDKFKKDFERLMSETFIELPQSNEEVDYENKIIFTQVMAAIVTAFNKHILYIYKWFSKEVDALVTDEAKDGVYYNDYYNLFDSTVQEAFDTCPSFVPSKEILEIVCFVVTKLSKYVDTSKYLDNFTVTMLARSKEA